MISIIRIDQPNVWDSFIKDFPDYDVYYLNGYVKAFQIHGDGTPVLLCYSNEKHKAACVLIRRDIAEDSIFKTYDLPHNKYFDLATPYGYGGLIFNSPNVSKNVVDDCNEEMVEFLKKNNYISAFFRFHPILHNVRFHVKETEILHLGKTIAMELESEDTIWQAITSKNRNMIRKAEKSNVQIRHGKGMDLLMIFKEIYNGTMRNDNADEYYYFNDAFYESIDHDLHDNYEVFYAELNGTIIAMAIIIFANRKLNYHLSGSKYEYRHLAPSNLLLYKVALWGYENGYKTFHLGGGVGSSEDNLYKFKSAFNRYSNYQFSIGKMIVRPEIYTELLELRGLNDETVLSQIGFFPQYRSK